MKNHILLVVLLLSAIGYAQNSINYKAVIKDDFGNAIAENTIQIKFRILESDAQTNVYEESHTPTADANGIIIVNIGEGAIISGIFNDINWGEDEHFLNVKIDTGAGFVDMGTTQFSAVPYAFHAKKAANITGLEAIDEGNGIGWRLVDRNMNNYGNIGFNAIDLSFVDDPNLGLGATGNYAFSLGYNGIASGEHALAFGNQNYALNDYAIAFGNNNSVTGLNSTAIGGINLVSGDYAIAAGLQNEASENYTVALGTNVTASAEYAIAMGQNTTASGANSTALGRNTEAIGEHAVAMGGGAEAQGDFSFAFGNESEAQGDNSIAMGDDAFATNNYAVAIGRDTFASGQSSFAAGYDTQASGSHSTALGHNTEASRNYATAMGNFTKASEDFSTAMGNGTEASGNASTAMGNYTLASGSSSTAMGNFSEASGQSSTAMGYSSDATGNYATAMGYNTEASGIGSTTSGFYTHSESYASFVVGRNNIGGGTPNTWVNTDPLFEIGNGGFIQGDTSNAMTVLKNGNIGIGTHNPDEKLHIANGRLKIGSETIEDTGNNRLSFNADLLPDNDGVMRLGNSDTRWLAVWVTNGAVNTSDKRSKTNIANLSYGLKDVIKLNPVSFNWKTNPNDDTKLGLIAQDLLKVIPEVVKTHDWETDESGNKIKKKLKRMGVYYSDLVPVLIKAIQEQQQIIASQKEENIKQNSELSSINDTLKTLLSRIEMLESDSSN